MTHRFQLVGLVAALALIAGCVPDNVSDFDFKALQPPAPPPELTGDVLVGNESAGPLTVELYADRGGAHLGMNALSARIARGGAQQTNARITWTATPTDGPAAGVELATVDPPTQADAEGFFRGEAFLLTPDTTARSFEITVQITPLDGATQEATFAVDARNDIWQQISDDLLISWVSPARPVVGANTFEVAAHRWTGTTFEAVDGATPSLSPYMDMGGGDGHSTPFTEPTGVGNGRYRSTVDFIMSGGWEMGVSLALPGRPTDTIRFVGYTVYEP
ncbi:MAG: FixH family protein [Bacteroidota bacterium]